LIIVSTFQDLYMSNLKSAVLTDCPSDKAGLPNSSIFLLSYNLAPKVLFNGPSLSFPSSIKYSEYFPSSEVHFADKYSLFKPAACFGSVHNCVTFGRKCLRCLQGKTGHSPHCNPTKCVEFLLSKSVNPDVIIDSETYLHMAVNSNMDEALSMLLKKINKSTLNKRDSSGKTALDLALEGKVNSAAKILIAAGGQASSRNEKLLASLSEVTRCSYCQNDNPKTRLLRCSRCMLVSYCSVQCQSSDWKAHKPSCKKS